MSISIDKYKKYICLEKYFQPAETSLSEVDKDKIVNSLLKELGIKDAIDSYAKKRKILEKLLTHF